MKKSYENEITKTPAAACRSKMVKLRRRATSRLQSGACVSTRGAVRSSSLGSAGAGAREPSVRAGLSQQSEMEAANPSGNRADTSVLTQEQELTPIKQTEQKFIKVAQSSTSSDVETVLSTNAGEAKSLSVTASSIETESSEIVKADSSEILPSCNAKADVCFTGSQATLFIKGSETVLSEEGAALPCSEQSANGTLPPVSTEQKKLKTLEDFGIVKRSFGIMLSETENYTEELESYLMQCIKEGICTDVRVQIGKQRYACNWIILVLYSEYFRELGYNEVIVLDAAHVAPEGFKLLYRTLLPEQRLKAQHKELLLVLKTAQFLRVEIVVRECWSMIDRNPDYHPLYALICYNDAKRLQFDDVAQMLQRNDLCVHDEVQVLLSAVRWLYYDWPKRKENARELLRCVRFTLCNPNTLLNLTNMSVLEQPLQEVLQDEEVQARLVEALRYKCFGTKVNSDTMDEMPRSWVTHSDGSKPCYCAEPVWNDKIAYWECFQQHINVIGADIVSYYKRLVLLGVAAKAEDLI